MLTPSLPFLSPNRRASVEGAEQRRTQRPGSRRYLMRGSASQVAANTVDGDERLPQIGEFGPKLSSHQQIGFRVLWDNSTTSPPPGPLPIATHDAQSLDACVAGVGNRLGTAASKDDRAAEQLTLWLSPSVPRLDPPANNGLRRRGHPAAGLPRRSAHRLRHRHTSGRRARSTSSQPGV